MPPNLLDLAPLTKQVTIRGAEYEVSGIDIADIARVLFRFPAIQKIATGDATKIESAQAVFFELIAEAPDAVNYILAAGLGVLGDPEQEQAVKTRLSLEEKCDVFEAIVDLTLPSGVGPFVLRLRRYLALWPRKSPNGVDRVEAAGTSSTASPSPSSM